MVSHFGLVAFSWQISRMFLYKRNIIDQSRIVPETYANFSAFLETVSRKPKQLFSTFLDTV